MRVPLKNYLEKLGLSKLKKEQKEIVTSVLNGKDIIGVLPTGFGKSICYILPHMILMKTVIVISPLISLMKDQQRRYKDVCTIVTSFSQNMDLDDRQITHDQKKDIFDGKLPCVIYMTPENFLSRESWIKGMEKHISLIAIDECHCISSWSEFRSSYTALNKINKWFKKRPPIMAVTGTATKKTINLVANVLELKNPVYIHISPTRDNLNLSVMYKHDFKNSISIIRDKIQGKTIVYCKTQKDTEKISNALSHWGYVSGYYHAGLSRENRDSVQNKFTLGKIEVLAATVAFGMGIDISDIETIIHYGIPKDMESYCQEIGRAARNKNMQGTCCILWSKGDFVINNIFLKKIDDYELRSKQREQMKGIELYVKNTNICRMRLIRDYFQGTYYSSDGFKCNNCDNCMNKKDFSNHLKTLYI